MVSISDSEALPCGALRAAAVIVAAVTLSAAPLRAQVETVPASHPVYSYLKRLELKGVIGRYFDAVLPLSRKQVADFLVTAAESTAALTGVESALLEEYRSEFRVEITGSTDGIYSLIPAGLPGVTGGLAGEFGEAEKFLFAYRDSSVSFFVNGLLTVDARWSSQDGEGDENVSFIQFGGRARGTILDHLGFSLQATNAQFWGSRELLQADPVISQSYALGTLDAQNFDFVEGYARYEGGVVSAQIGRERLLWGTGYDQKMIASENVRVYDFLRFDAGYRAVKYTFIHAWLLGRESTLQFTLPSDTAAVFTEPVVADKYFAAHRFELSFPGLLDVGAQEMVIYSNRAPDLAYLNPVTLLESAQRSREERDNVFWAFDVQLHLLKGLELSGAVLFDDLHLDKFFDDSWYNRYAYQAGLMLVDPLFLDNVTLAVEYTRVEPYTFAHNRSRDNDYGSLGAILGPRIGPNADSWYLRLDAYPSRNLTLSGSVLFTRRGENEVDAAGFLLRNVGGDILQPHRDSDPETRVFLDGVRFSDSRVFITASWQFVHQMWFEPRYLFTSIRNVTEETSEIRHEVSARVRIEL